MNDPTQPSESQDRRALIAVVLCVAVFFAWNAFFGPRTPPADAVTQAPATTETTDAASATAETPSTSTSPDGSTPATVPAPVASTETDCTDQRAEFKTDALALDAATCNGGLTAIRFPNTPAPMTVTPWWTWVWSKLTGADGGWAAYGPESGVETLMDGGGFAVAGRGEFAPGGSYTVVQQDPLVLRRTTADGLSITQTFTRTDKPDQVGLTVDFESSVPLTGPFWVGVVDKFQKIVKQTDPFPGLQAGVDGHLWLLSQGGKRSGCAGMVSSISAGELQDDVGWVGVADRYYVAALVPEAADLRLRYQELQDGRVAAWTVAPQENVAPGQPVELKYTIYAGQKEINRLLEVGHDLDEAISFGLFGFFSRILLFVLHLIQKVATNWGVSIVLLTLSVRGAFYPLSAAAFRNGKKMQLVQPRLKAMQELYKDDKDAQTRATMELFQREKVNPLGGCMPIFFQIPVFFALYAGLQTTPDLFHADFLWVKDLSAPDPLGVFPFLIFVGMVAQQKLNPVQGMDPQQAQMMRFMPFIFSFMMFSLPAGLSLYYATNSGLAILQQWYNTRAYGQPAQGVIGERS